MSLDRLSLPKGLMHFLNLIEKKLKFYDLMIKSTTSKEGELYELLSSEQKDVLMVAEEESNDAANLISHKEQKKKHKKWL
jgi:hypothetical protein